MNARELHLNNFVLKKGLVVCLNTPYLLFKAMMEIDKYEEINIRENTFKGIADFIVIDETTIQSKNFRNIKLALKTEGTLTFVEVLMKDEVISYKYEVHSLQNFWYELVGEELGIDINTLNK